MGLFGYVLLLDAGLLLMAVRKGWTRLAHLSLGATLLRELLWFGRFMAPGKLPIAAAAFGLFALLFLVLPSLAPAGQRGDLLRGAVLGGLSPFLFVLYLAPQAAYADSWPALFLLMACLDAAIAVGALRRGQVYLLLAAAVATVLSLLLWAGGLAEESLVGATLGALGLCVLLSLPPRPRGVSWLAPAPPPAAPPELGALAAALGLWGFGALLAARGLGDPPWTFLVLLLGLLALALERGRPGVAHVAPAAVMLLALGWLAEGAGRPRAACSCATSPCRASWPRAPPSAPPCAACAWAGPRRAPRSWAPPGPIRGPCSRRGSWAFCSSGPGRCASTSRRSCPSALSRCATGASPPPLAPPSWARCPWGWPRCRAPAWRACCAAPAGVEELARRRLRNLAMMAAVALGFIYGVAALLLGGALRAPVEEARLGARALGWQGRLRWATALRLLGLLLFALINLEIADCYGSGRDLELGGERRSARDLTTSVAWGIYALCLLGVGMWRRARALRFVSLGFMLLCMGKVFLYDLSRLRGLYQVVAFLGLAVSLIGVSLLYQRFVFRKEPSP